MAYPCRTVEGLGVGSAGVGQQSRLIRDVVGLYVIACDAARGKIPPVAGHFAESACGAAFDIVHRRVTRARCPWAGTGVPCSAALSEDRCGQDSGQNGMRLASLNVTRHKLEVSLVGSACQEHDLS